MDMCRMHLYISHSLRGSVDWNHIHKLSGCDKRVTPYAGVWIEICSNRATTINLPVTPYAGVWIEIHDAAIPCIPRSRSLPTRECGLKLYLHFQDLWLQASLPTRECGLKFDKHVSGVGIKTSLPTRECGLKFAGKTIKTNIGRHSLRGSVDWNNMEKQRYSL